jgi:hypothetical protein
MRVRHGILNGSETDVKELYFKNLLAAGSHRAQ